MIQSRMYLPPLTEKATMAVAIRCKRKVRYVSATHLPPLFFKRAMPETGNRLRNLRSKEGSYAGCN